MPSNGRHHRTKICKVCDDVPAPVLAEIDTRMAAGQQNSDIRRWMRQQGHETPSTLMLNRHRDGRHYMGDRTIHESSDSLIASEHRDGLNLMQRVQLNVSHVLLPRLALAPKKLNVLEEMQEIYAFTKNQAAIEFEIQQNTPEVYEHPVTGETQLVTPTSPNMLKLIQEMRRQLVAISEESRQSIVQEDIMPELITKLMAAIQGEDERLAEVEEYIIQTAELVEDETEVSGN